jgi:peptidase M50-like protein
MSDLVYSALEAFHSFMSGGSLTELIVAVLLTGGGIYVVVALHECGHALAALLMGKDVHELRVGTEDRLHVTWGRFRLTLGVLEEGGDDAAGHVVWDAGAATPMQVFVITVAGPIANLLAALVLAVVAASFDGPAAVCLFLAAMTHARMGVTNLWPGGDPQRPDEWNDGRWAAWAWARRGVPPRVAPRRADPNAATSVPPPGAPRSTSA